MVNGFSETPKPLAGSCL